MASGPFTIIKESLVLPRVSVARIMTRPGCEPALNFPVILVLDGFSNFDHPVIKYTVKRNKNGPQSGKGHE